MTVLTVSPDGSLTLPADEVALLGLSPNATVELEVDLEHELLAVRGVDDDSWLCGEESLSSFRQGVADIEAGRVREMSEADLRRLAPCD